MQNQICLPNDFGGAELSASIVTQVLNSPSTWIPARFCGAKRHEPSVASKTLEISVGALADGSIFGFEQRPFLLIVQVTKILPDHSPFTLISGSICCSLRSGRGISSLLRIFALDIFGSISTVTRKPLSSCLLASEFSGVVKVLVVIELDKKPTKGAGRVSFSGNTICNNCELSSKPTSAQTINL